ncbi:response regulator transcription factor [Arachnia rubra]|uniref:Response regulator transcription factor n=1 Tax=Arachnia rubra TaxID=1547448 RepID=A0ABX7Y8T7_9ACTN|nr:response regulator transcription factor [Arachnia rubra]MBB1571451.1 response regulator transcription factor [Propionibacterium sp.]MDO4644245.1 response regulator transcription factor [Propionibacteriaceae bacterium]QUC09467.1 response regulator transcription factor [Arachnia rubra]BCR80956.1 DNA-binding response regulator [Arachnia rubra]
MRVLIADDSVLLREGLTFILDDGGHEVIAAVGSGTELVPRALELRPELIITDIRMPPSNTDEGLRAAVEIRKKWADAPILLLSQYVVAAYVQELLADGGSRLGYLLKDRVADIDTFLDAADRVAGGGLVLDPEVVSQVFGRGRNNDPLQQLTAREREVLELMAEGHTNTGIAQRLFVTEGAIEKHTQRIFGKLGLHADPSVHRRVKAVLTLLG